MKCGTQTQAPQGLFCGNFLSERGTWPRCEKSWCPGCYVAEDMDFFWVGQRKNKGNRLWKRKEDEERYQYNRAGDMLMTPFQCEWCWYLNLKGSLPIKGGGANDCLLTFIRQVNLDVMWSKEPGTVRSALGQYTKAQDLVTELGLLSPNFPIRGP